MSDLIDRQTAIEAVRHKICDYIPILWGKQQEIPLEVEMVLVRLPSAEPRWIPVSERLPEIKEHHVSDVCLVCLKDHGMTFAELQENIFGQVGWDVEREDDYHEPIGEVVAWIPLPEPYQEGKNASND